MYTLTILSICPTALFNATALGFNIISMAINYIVFSEQLMS